MADYKVTINELYKDVNAKEKIMIKDFSDAVGLDDATSQGPVEITVANFAVLDVHNENSSQNKDYKKYVILDVNGTKFVTGSHTFYRSLSQIAEEFTEEGITEDIKIRVFKQPSKNYKGKDFITCTVVL